MRKRAFGASFWHWPFCLVVVAFGTVWLYRAAHRGPAASGEPAGPQPVALSDATLTVLQKLDSSLKSGSTRSSIRRVCRESAMAFASRVDQLLSAYQQAAGGKIKLIRFDSQSNLSPNAASADGIQAFNLDKGERLLSRHRAGPQWAERDAAPPFPGMGASPGTRCDARHHPPRGGHTPCRRHRGLCGTSIQTPSRRSRP